MQFFSFLKSDVFLLLVPFSFSLIGLSGNLFLFYIIYRFLKISFFSKFFNKKTIFYPQQLCKYRLCTFVLEKRRKCLSIFYFFLRRQSGDLKLMVLLFAVCLPQQPKKKIHTHHVLFLVFMTCEVVIFLLISFENINVLEL